jgi:hypothetical protein
MRRAAQIAVLAGGLVLVPALAAQRGATFHGTPASATSITPSHNAGMHVNNHFNVNGGQFHHGGRFGYGHRPSQRPVYGYGGYYPAYGYPYSGYGYGGYGYSYPIDYSTYMQPEPQPAPEPEPEREALTMFDRGTYRGSERSAASLDPRYGEHYTDGREHANTAQPQAAPQPAQSTSALEPEETTILVFRDGHQIEIGNYAIVGAMLYDLSARSGRRSPKIQLAELDIPATVRVNEQNGVDFKLPRQKSQ